HHVRAADAFRSVHARVLAAARFGIRDALGRVLQHVLLRAEHERPGRARLDAGRLATDRDAIGAQRALVGLSVDLRDPRDIERAARDAIAAADAVLAVRGEHAARVVHHGPGRGA